MFLDYISLTKLQVNNFKTNKVIDMSNMFSGCSLLNSLDISNFETNTVKSISKDWKIFDKSELNKFFEFHCWSLLAES